MYVTSVFEIFYLRQCQTITERITSLVEGGSCSSSRGGNDEESGGFVPSVHPRPPGLSDSVVGQERRVLCERFLSAAPGATDTTGLGRARLQLLQTPRDRGVGNPRGTRHQSNPSMAEGPGFGCRPQPASPLIQGTSQRFELHLDNACVHTSYIGRKPEILQLLSDTA